MLTYFPTPYPGELFYSVLCRYYMSSGIREHNIVKRLYAVQRGRKADQRDERDLLVAYKAGVLRELLLSQGMVEEVVLC